MTKEEVQAIIREELVRAMAVMVRSARYEAQMTESEIEERAANVCEAVADRTSVRLTCPHEAYRDWGGYRTCSRCGEPEQVPDNPFKEK